MNSKAKSITVTTLKINPNFSNNLDFRLKVYISEGEMIY